MTNDERIVLIKYHARLLIRWADDKFAGKDYLLANAERTVELIKELEGRDA